MEAVAGGLGLLFDGPTLISLVGGVFYGLMSGLGFGVYEATQTGDWTRAALTTGTSIAVGVGVTALVAAGVVTAPAWAVVLAGGALAAGAAWGVGQIYDNWDDITSRLDSLYEGRGRRVHDGAAEIPDARGEGCDHRPLPARDDLPEARRRDHPRDVDPALVPGEFPGTAGRRNEIGRASCRERG